MSIDCGSPRVLVMDDDADVLASLERGLRLSGFDVATAKDRTEALRSATHTRPDAIVVDTNLPVAEHTTAVLSCAQLLDLVWGNSHFASDTGVGFVLRAQ